GRVVSTQVGGRQKEQTEQVAKPEKSAGTAQEPDNPSDAPTPTSATPDPRDAQATGTSQAPETSENPAEPSAEAGTEPPPQTVASEQSEQPSEPAAAAELEQPAPPQPEQAVPLEDGQPAPPEVEQPVAVEGGQAITPQVEQSPAPESDQPAPPQAGQPLAPETEQTIPAQAEDSPPAQAGDSAPAQAEQPVQPTDGPRPKADQGRPKQVRLTKRELKKKRAEEKKVKAFRDYFDYSEEIKKIPPHRVLAISRGERAKVLRVKITSDTEAMHRALGELLVPPEHPHAEYLRGCARDALGRLILPSLEREIRRELTDRAETHAVKVFARNLRNLLLQPPVRDRRLLAVDPGFKSGCKLAALDQFGNLLEQGVIFLVGPPERRKQAQRKVIDLVNRYQLSVVVIGNGTACRQTEEFFSELIAGELKDRDVAYVIVNEAGASVYSTSRIGREEFPNYDASLRGAISIGRRLQDPLSELVKIDAANIGVGLYQHDVKAKHLRSSLDEVVESCVNYVGVDVNTASPALLRYVSGLNQLTARRVYEHRREHGPFPGREQLREVPGFGEATFVQAAGFLKIAGGDNPLDATWIHPESYEVASRVLENLECTATDLTDKQAAGGLAQRVAGVDLEAMAAELEVGTLTLKDILAQLARPGRDPREDLPAPVFKQGVLKLEDLSPGMELHGTVLNVVDFGAFVDIGMHDSGLVHVSQLADKYVRDPHEVVAVGDVVNVWVIDVDKERRRVSLTMIQPGSERPRHPRRGGKREDGKESSEGGEGRGQRRPKPREQRGPKPKGRPRSKGPPGRKGPPKSKYRPKSRPKPVIPITDAMKDGKEPMRTFGDLAQFFDQQPPQPDGSKQEESQDAKPQTPVAKDQVQSEEPESPTTHDETQVAEPEVPTTLEETPGEETPGTEPEATTQDQAPTPQDEVQDKQDAAQDPPEQSEPNA
ncbi:MAG: helix-hairpin-helix domain-containing protein, partial [Planctomycetota bacterium]